MVISDGLALTSYTRDVHYDGWIGREAHLYVLAYARFQSMLVGLWIPDSFAPRDVSLSCEGWVGKARLAPGELSEIALPCRPPHGGVGLRICIPSAQASPPDERILGAMLHALTGVP